MVKTNKAITGLKNWIAGKINDGNPDKYNFYVKRRLDIGKDVIIEINYPDCRNHNRNKILVYDDKEIFECGLKSKCLDPPLSEN